MTDRKVPSDYATIQEAVDASEPWDRIIVASGYSNHEHVIMPAMPLFVDATADVANVVLEVTNQPGEGARYVSLRGEASFRLLGSEYSDTLQGNDGGNYIDGGGGADYISSGSFNGGGTNTLIGGDGADRISTHWGNNTCSGGDGDDFFGTGMYGYPSRGSINGGDGIDTIGIGAPMPDQPSNFDLARYDISMVEAINISRYSVKMSFSQAVSFHIIAGGNSETGKIGISLAGLGGIIDFSSKISGVKAVHLHDVGMTSGYKVTGTKNDDILEDSDYDDTLNGGNGADEFIDINSRDNDTFNGGAGDDLFSLRIANASGTIVGGEGTDTIAATDISSFQIESVEVLENDRNSEKIIARIEQLYLFDSIRFIRNIEIVGAGGTIDLTEAIGQGYTVDLDAERATSGMTVSGTTSINVLTGSRYDDILRGGAGDDTLFGAAGTDLLDGGAGNDRLTGSGGDIASYASATAAVQVSLAATAAQDTGGAGTDTLAGFANLAGSAFSDTLTGDRFVNRLEGGAGNDTLDGAGGADRMIGGNGDDTFVVDASGDVAIEAAGGGTDTVRSAFNCILSAVQEIENLTLVGTRAINGTGNARANAIRGNDNANTLNGGAGADTLTGWAGNDTFVVDTVGDRIVEATGGGNDRVNASVSYRLAGGQEIEVLGTTSAAGTASINLTGNELAQTLYGNAGANTLNGAGGIDTLLGYGGNDTYVVDTNSDRILDVAGGGVDRVNASVSYVLYGGQEIEFLGTTSAAGTAAINLKGNAFAQTIYGNAGANILNGAGGADTLQGFGGHDTYVVDAAGDRVLEAATSGGVDRVTASVSWALAAGQGVETLGTTSAAGTTAINLTGNELAQTLYGNGGANVLDGAGGSDTLSGFGNADTFSFTSALGAGNIDHITDFSAAADTIRLAKTIFAALGTGTLAASAYKDIGDPGAVVDASDRILYNDDSGALYYDTNGSGAGGRTLFAILDNKPATLTNADFVVVA